MIYFLEISAIALYGVLMAFILFYSFSQLNLIINYLKNKKQPIHQPDLDFFPQVTVQLPVYNEKYVIERLIDAVANFDYPKGKLEIQVLDDSTDETVEIIEQKVAEIKARGFDIAQIRRTNRTGFKAGALKDATQYCKGEFIAIFDADFVPSRDFLVQTIPHFVNNEVGVVQTRWGHLNRKYSLLTELQAFGLDAHFSIEQSGRNAGKHFINFNGTAGVWRKECIVDAGGWSADTLTEDLDLSYRAQLKGWEFKYLEDVESPAELPAVMEALKSQQYRWTKGAAECAKKNLVKVLKSNTVKTSTKVHAIFHLMNSFLFICIMGLALLSVPMLYIKQDLPEYSVLFKIGTVFLASLVILAVFYRISSKRNGMSFGQYLIKFPLFLSVSMGLSFYNARAVLEGYLGKKSEFVRTPKFNLVKRSDKWSGNHYIGKKLKASSFVELLLTLYFAFGIYVGFKFGDFGLAPFHILLTFGFGTVFIYSVSHAFKTDRNTTKTEPELNNVGAVNQVNPTPQRPEKQLITEN